MDKFQIYYEKKYVDPIQLYCDGIGKVELIDYMGTDITITNAARVSFGKHKAEMDEKDIKLIKYLIKNKHTSTLEHNVMTFRFTVPLFVRSQHHRHRTWSYNEISRRYTDDNIQFYIPKKLKKQASIDRQASADESIENEKECLDKLKIFFDSSFKTYNEMIDNGVSREMARGVLPMNLYTEYYGTVNLNNAFKFLVLRLDSHAQWEIQQVAKAMLEMMKVIYPISVSSFQEVTGHLLETK